MPNGGTIKNYLRKRIQNEIFKNETAYFGRKKNGLIFFNLKL